MRSTHTSKRVLHPRAFTLIELLIVVAIIAILAAIAVPNFLEAQVRSKVSRAMADMRSLATALECYAVDYNRYPFQGAVGMNPAGDPTRVIVPVGVSGCVAPNDTGPGSKNGSPQKRFIKFVPHTITTPVSYITTQFEDPFATQMPEPAPATRHYFYNYFDDSINWMVNEGGKTMQQISKMLHKREMWGKWMLMSCGPDLDRLDIEGSTVGNRSCAGLLRPDQRHDVQW